MKINQEILRRIIVEEYIKEEGLEEADQEEIEKLLRQIRRDKYLPPEERDGRRYKTNDGETMPMGIPHKREAPESDYSGFQDRAGPPLEDQLMDLIQGIPPEEVSDLFQAVFSKIPGVEIGPPEEEEPESLYSPGSEGRPTAGFKLEELKTLIRKVLEEEYSQDTDTDNEETVAKKDV